MELTVTGLSFKLAGDLPKEERVKVVENFLARLKGGEEVLLMAEPMNPVDENAIAAFIDYRQIGYLSKDYTEMVRPLLDENGQCRAVVKGHDSHLTLFVTVPDAAEGLPSLIKHERRLPASPLGASVRLGIADDENRGQLIASNLVAMEVCKENMPQFMRLLELYLPLMNLTICCEDTLWLQETDRKLRDLKASWQELGLGAEDGERLARLYNNVHACAGDLHTMEAHIPEQIFIAHLDRLRQNSTIVQPFYKKYCDTFLDKKDFSEADREKMAAERERLLGWLRGMEWDELRNPADLLSMGYRVNYLRLSRQELYDLYSVLLLLERLEAAEKESPASSFWERVAEARKGLITSKRHWFVPCKCLMWMGEVRENDFRTAASMVQEHFPDERLDHKDLSRLNVQSFRKRLDKWDEQDAPAKGKTYKKYHELAVFLMQG